MGEDIHGAHRSRMRERFDKQGMDGLQDHEVLEMLLYYSVPRADTNPTAHRLLKAFGTLHGVLEARPEALTQVEGVGQRSAQLIGFVRELAKRYETDRVENEMRDIPLTTSELIGAYIMPRFLGMTEERSLAVCTDQKGKILCVEELGKGTIRATEISVRRLAEAAMRVGAASVIIAHNHPSGFAAPSHDDLVATRRIREAMNGIGVRLRDHIIVAGDDFVSLRDSNLLDF